MDRYFVKGTYICANVKAGHESGVVTHCFLCHTLCVVLGLRLRDPWLQPANHVVVPVRRTRQSELFLVETHRNPQFALIQMTWSQRKFEIARHDSGYDVRLTIKLDRAPQNVR